MKTIKITNEKLYNERVVSAEIEYVGSNEYSLELQLVEAGMKTLFPENWNERKSIFTETGEFGRYEYAKELGFEII